MHFCWWGLPRVTNGLDLLRHINYSCETFLSYILLPIPQCIAGKLKCDIAYWIISTFFFHAGELVKSPIYGKPSTRTTDDDHRSYRLTFAPNERIESIEIGAGHWIDSVQLNTNLKSTPRVGGDGGRKTKIKVLFLKKFLNNNIVRFVVVHFFIFIFYFFFF